MKPIPFEQFMAKALHDPQHGYYARKIQTIGHGGDFTTAPMVSNTPALAIATWANRALRESRCRNLIEIGPGTGALAAAVMKSLPSLTRWKTRLHLVETSEPLTKIQRHRLGSRATWHHTIHDALTACDGHAVIYSNEWVDAFPVRRFEKTTTGWQEIAVHFEDQHVPRESLMPLGPLPESSGFRTSHPIGQRIEVHESFHRHLTDWLPLWKSGKMLTIDYGAEAETLYHRRPHGTLRAYLLQQRLEGLAIYQNIGRQDLTADVNFTDLQNWSQPWVSQQRLMTFGDFLISNSKSKSTAPHAAHDFLTDHHGAGDAFLVLEQHPSSSPPKKQTVNPSRVTV
jgi:SAM-dependent MidA family methyltransferase